MDGVQPLMCAELSPGVGDSTGTAPGVQPLSSVQSQLPSRLPHAPIPRDNEFTLRAVITTLGLYLNAKNLFARVGMSALSKALDTESAPTQQVLGIALNFCIHLLLFTSEGKKWCYLARKSQDSKPV